MKTSLVALLLIFTAVLMPVPASAEVIRLKNGGMVRGSLTKRTPAEVEVQTETGLIVLEAEDILSVQPELNAGESDQAIHLHESALNQQQAVRPDARVPAASRGGHSELAPGGPGDDPSVPSLTDASIAVALVGAVYEDGSSGLGSGAVVTNRGLIVTNAHVVVGATELQVMLPDARGAISYGRPSKIHTARLLKANECYDLALLRISKDTPHYLRLAADVDVRVGMEVRAIGNPAGLAVSVSKGIISAIRTVRELGMDTISFPVCEYMSDRKLGDMTFLQTDAAISPGSSGGPLLNEQNEVVGITTLYDALDIARGLNIAVHVKHVRELAGRYLEE